MQQKENKAGISVIIPAYKEAQNLVILLPKIKDALQKLHLEYEILVIDTMQKMDDTQEVCNKCGIKCIKRQGGNLYGDAIRTGIKNAQFFYIAIMDGDGSHSPYDLPLLYNNAQKTNADLVIGSRYIKGGNSCNGLVLKLMSYMLNITYRIVFGIKAKDVSNSFRLYKAQQLKSISLECNNFDIVEEILIKLTMAKKDFLIQEVPVFFDKRKYGQSKRDLKKFIFSYLATMKRLLKAKQKALKYAKKNN